MFSSTLNHSKIIFAVTLPIPSILVNLFKEAEIISSKFFNSLEIHLEVSIPTFGIPKAKSNL